MFIKSREAELCQCKGDWDDAAILEMEWIGQYRLGGPTA